MPELSSRYNSKEVESKWYTLWEKKGYFRPKSDREGKDSKAKPYVVVIPPPNVTGILHMGHALNNTIQDILTRWNRMKGRDTLWIPGTDHAGIATQNVVERKLAKEKKSRHELGREKFLEQVWTWKEEYGNTITRQLRRLGASCDWSRERFTMDEGLSEAVKECFVTLYDRGLIYRGNYIINWCPRCQTALSDEEAAHKDVQGGLYHIQYPIKNTKDHIVIATTRPETLLGDVAVAVNPKDERYKNIIGKKLILPLINREIPIIADEFVDPEFGTGLVKVTPAHDPNDFEMGNRHNLEQINVMHPDGKINENGGAYEGMDRFKARKQVLADLEEQGLFVKKEKHMHAVGHCYRCDTVVEPYLSKQWFVKMKPLADKALAAYKEGKTHFYPDRWTKVYTNWLEGIRDWCISRQIWWGHQIPAWYDEDGNIFVAKTEEEAKQKAKEKNGKEAKLTQESDVLDTWFSSWLWPFSTLGWPKETEDLKHFYPTTDLITASEIIFFWVARMIMAGLEFRNEVPFANIYIHGTVRAEGGLKMSKSLGNSIDPLEVIDEIGADALRYSMIMLSAQDVYLSREKFEVGRNFTNKIWNASRFVLMNMKDFKTARLDYQPGENLPLPSRWILSRLERIYHEVDKQLSHFGMAQATTELYHFIWNDLCDWFIEFAKPAFSGGDATAKEQTQQVLFFVLEKTMRLLHPYAPFISEEIWSKLKEVAQDGKDWPESLMFSTLKDEDFRYEDQNPFRDEETERLIGAIQRSVGEGIREIRGRLNVPPSQKLKAILAVKEKVLREVFSTFEPQIKMLGRIEELKIVENYEKTKSTIGNAFPDFEVFVEVEGLVDPKKERSRIQKKIAEVEKYVRSLNGKLSNEKFVKNAPQDVVEKERKKLSNAEKELKSHQELLSIFQ